MKSSSLKQNVYLIIGALFLFSFALYQLSAVFWTKEMIIYNGGPAQMMEKNYTGYVLLCILITLIAVAGGLYSLSGAGKFYRLPLLRTMLVTITAVFLLRGMMLISDVMIIQKYPELELTRFAIYSSIALIIGSIYLFGVIKFFKLRRNIRQSDI